jgi:acetylornithine deacetylase/succinyl-diaminopimelate desuccinylase-like protein
MSDQATQNPIALLQRLVRFDTTNPPGDESACITYIREILHGAGIATQILAQSPDRPNLLARLPGQGNAPLVLLYGHVDVVKAENQSWEYPPFEGLLADGFLWGRGTLDMKGGVAMMLSALLRARAESAPLPGDVILAILSDEEAGGDAGARFLVENHPDQFQDVQYAIGEFGGFSLQLGGRKFYPIQVAEKQICWMKATVRGPGGHGSMPWRGSCGRPTRRGFRFHSCWLVSPMPASSRGWVFKPTASCPCLCRWISSSPKPSMPPMKEFPSKPLSLARRLS